MNGGDIVAKLLQSYGVRYLFTLCGGHISPIFVGAEKIGIRVIDTRHEVNAVFAADAVARLTGIPGVVAVTAGPGLTNTITAVKNAYLAQSPLIVFGGAAATLLKGRGALQDIDQISLMRPNVKWATGVSKVSEIAPVIKHAFKVAKSGVPGPVFIEIPVDVLYGEELVQEWYGKKSSENKPVNIKERVIQWYIRRHARKLFAGKDNVDFSVPMDQKMTIKAPKSSKIRKMASMIKRSKQPLMIIGSGAMMQPQKAKALADAVKTLGIPVYLSGMARGLLGTDHTLLMRHQRRKAIKSADLIILAGVPNDFRLDYGNHVGRRLLISINRSKEDLYKNKKPTLPILADPLDTLIEVSGQINWAGEEWNSTLQTLQSEREQQIDQQATETTNDINPIQAFRALDPLMSTDAIMVADGGDFVATASYTLKARHPLSWLDPGVFGTLGVGAGFALGAKLVYPDKDVWIIYGDGSAGYSLVEYDTFVRHNLPVISLIGNDACWTQIARDQVVILDSACAVDLEFSNYEKIGHAFGAEGEMVSDIPSLKNAVQNAHLKSRQGIPYIINARIGKTDFRKGSISI